jgi:hypothetical protein
MLAILTSLLFATFPVRGSAWVPLDSTVILDKDSLHLVSECPSHACGTCTFVLKESRIPGKTSALPGGRDPGYIARVTWSGINVTPNPLYPDTCPAQASLNPSQPNQFVFHGKSKWAVWPDFIQVKFVVSNEKPMKYVEKPVKIRWRWSRIEPAVPWLRWIDTLKINPSDPEMFGTPILTTLQNLKLDSIVPRLDLSNQCSNELTLDTLANPNHRSPSTGPASPFTWSYATRLCALAALARAARTPNLTTAIPTDSIPAGITFRIRDIASQPEPREIRTWLFKLAGTAVDSLMTVGSRLKATNVGAFPLGPTENGTRAFEVSTGRRIQLETPLPPGLHLQRGPGGMDVVVVK